MPKAGPPMADENLTSVPLKRNTPVELEFNLLLISPPWFLHVRAGWLNSRLFYRQDGRTCSSGQPLSKPTLSTKYSLYGFVNKGFGYGYVSFIVES